MAQTPALHKKTGYTVRYVPASTAVGAGQVVIQGSLVGIAVSDIAVGVPGILLIQDAFDCPKDTSTFTAGDAVYWNATGNPVLGTAGTGCATSTSSGNTLMGYARFAALTGDIYVDLRLNPTKTVSTTGGSLTADDITGTDSSLGISGLSAAQGGTVALLGGPSSTSGNAGGPVTVTGGTPGLTGIGGAVTIVGAVGGATSGAGGAVSMTGGAGTNGNAAGGAGSLVGGAGQGSAAGGAVVSTGGVGGATGAGGAVTATGGAGGATSGTGGAASVIGGAAQGTTAVGGLAKILGGASAGASGTAGGASVDAGAANSGTGGTVIIGDANAAAIYLNRGPLKALVIGNTYTDLGTNQSSAPTIAQLLGGALQQISATGAGVVTLPSGTAISAGMARTVVTGDTFSCDFVNKSGSQTLTITGATGSTVRGTATVASGKTATMKFINTGATAWDVLVIGGA